MFYNAFVVSLFFQHFNIFSLFVSVASVLFEFKQYGPVVRRSKALQNRHTRDLFESFLLKELFAADVMVDALSFFLVALFVKVKAVPCVLLFSRVQLLPNVYSFDFFANQAVRSSLLRRASRIVFRFVELFLL